MFFVLLFRTYSRVIILPVSICFYALGKSTTSLSLEAVALCRFHLEPRSPIPSGYQSQVFKRYLLCGFCGGAMSVTQGWAEQVLVILYHAATLWCRRGWVCTRLAVMCCSVGVGRTYAQPSCDTLLHLYMKVGRTVARLSYKGLLHCGSGWVSQLACSPVLTRLEKWFQNGACQHQSQ